MVVPHKNYRPWDAHTGRALTVSPQDALPQDDLVFFLLDTIPQLDLSAFHKQYALEKRGQPPYDVTLMVTLLVYAYAIGIRSSRKIAAACERNLAFLAIVGNQRPDFRTISDFRKIHLAAFTDLFIEVLLLAGEMGLVRLGNIATDGTKMGADASRHKAMSYGYMKKEIDRLRGEIEQLLQQADQTDAEQDAALGSRRGDELPEELRRRQQRLAKIEEAKQRLETQAQAEAEAEQQRRDEAEAQRQAEGRKRRGREPAPIDPTPADKAQTSFTDPEAKIMKQSNKGFDHSYNAQAVVDSTAQIIVTAEVSGEANDKKQAVPMASSALSNLEAAGIPLPTDAAGASLPIPNTMNSGYYSEQAVLELEELGVDPYVATERQKHHVTPSSVASSTREVATTVKEKMRAKLRSESGRALYGARKQIVEPVFGQIKDARGIRRFLLRGLSKVNGEWKLICLTHNLLKVWRASTGVIGC